VIRLALSAALTLVAGLAAAEEPGLFTGVPGSPPEGERRGKPREEIFRMVDSYVASNLQATLGLNEDQLARTLPVVRRLHADRRRFAERKIRALHQMKRMAREGTISEARAAELLQELKAAEAEESTAIRAGQDALDALLTPVQQVKYRVLESQIEHRVRELMARVRAQRRDAARQRGDAPPKESPAPR
jgi:hypothetical protein